jgi:hypothetical protein
MVEPLLQDWSELDRLRFDPDHFWWRRYLDQLDRTSKRPAGSSASAISS